MPVLASRCHDLRKTSKLSPFTPKHIRISELAEWCAWDSSLDPPAAHPQERSRKEYPRTTCTAVRDRNVRAQLSECTGPEPMKSQRPQADRTRRWPRAITSRQWRRWLFVVGRPDFPAEEPDATLQAVRRCLTAPAFAVGSASMRGLILSRELVPGASTATLE